MSVPSRDSRKVATGKLVALALAIGVGGFLGGIALGPTLLPPPPSESDPGEVEWPVWIGVNFDGAPADASLGLTLTVVRDNHTLGSSHYVVSRPAQGPEWVTLSFSQTLQAIPQTLKVVFELDSGSRSTSSYDVVPRDSCVTPRPYFTILWGSGASSIPYEGGTWILVPFQTVDC